MGIPHLHLPSKLELPIYSTIPLAIGIVALVRAAWGVLRFIRFHLLNFNSKHALEKYHHGRSFALVTGSAAGIGFGFAQELVRRGYGVIIHSRSQHKLDEATARLKAIRPDPSVRHLVCDAFDFTPDALHAALNAFADLPLSVLVNNRARRRHDTYSARDVDMSVALNARFMAHVTRAMLPALRRAPRSLILNLTSAARDGMPWSVAYSAAKGFATSFSYALTRELRAVGASVDCLLVVPGTVHSQYNNRKQPRGTPTADAYARMTLERVDAAVGWGWLEMVPSMHHDLLLGVGALLPEMVYQRALVGQMQRYLKPKDGKKD
ncbi:Uu.00g140270.m01.CDS01 [Anthostomella pinea]|uniref:Uu.00g140270.m01.CDS01 n=1 Tax=Anthostomella pinea TaxID=933095 RepID=A0AAI8YIZ2_9PEZI|nr:Uu.00g140270.m01.CDS01 [Anthostomella pinea]